MKCGKAQKLISLHLTGDLDYRQDEQVKEHLITCDTCAEEAESYRQSLKSLEMLKARTMPASFWDGYMDEIRERIHSSEPEHPARVSRFRSVYAAIAVAAAVLLAVAVVWSLQSGAPVAPPGLGTGTVETPGEKTSPRITDVYDARGGAGEQPNFHFASDKADAILETEHAGDF